MKQEPVAWLWPHQLEDLQHYQLKGIRAWSGKHHKPDGLIPVYTSPPQRKPLTEEEILSLFRTSGSPVLFARAIEAKHGIT